MCFKYRFLDGARLLHDAYLGGRPQVAHIVLVGDLPARIVHVIDAVLHDRVPLDEERSLKRVGRLFCPECAVRLVSGSALGLALMWRGA